MKTTIGTSVKTGGICALLAGFCWVGGLLAGVTVAAQLGLIGLISIVIWQACEPFAEVAQWVGRHYRIPGSVRGATLDAVASSLPELFTAIFFVVLFDDFSSTVAICAGSAVYNMLLIPALCTLMISFVRPQRPVISVSPDVVKRDGMWFLLSEFVLLYCLFTHRVSLVMAGVFIMLYAGYVFHLVLDAKAHRRGRPSEAGHAAAASGEAVCLLGGLIRLRLTPSRAAAVLGVSTGVTGAACYVLVGTCEALAEALDVPAFFVAVIIAAAASSVPDTMLSLGAARRGDDSGAVSNAFGSNTFDVDICLAVPILVYAAQEEGADVPWSGGSEVVWLGVLLWVFSAVALGLLRHGYSLGRRKALILCAMYAMFVGYAVAGSIAAQ